MSDVDDCDADEEDVDNIGSDITKTSICRSGGVIGGVNMLSCLAAASSISRLVFSLSALAARMRCRSAS